MLLLGRVYPSSGQAGQLQGLASIVISLLAPSNHASAGVGPAKAVRVFLVGRGPGA